MIVGCGLLWYQILYHFWSKYVRCFQILSCEDLLLFFSNGTETLRWLNTSTECGDWSFVSPSVCKCSGALLTVPAFLRRAEAGSEDNPACCHPFAMRVLAAPTALSSSCRIRRQQERCNTWSYIVWAPTAAASLQGMLLPLRWTGTAGWGGIQHTG